MAAAAFVTEISESEIRKGIRWLEFNKLLYNEILNFSLPVLFKVYFGDGEYWRKMGFN